MCEHFVKLLLFLESFSHLMTCDMMLLACHTFVCYKTLLSSDYLSEYSHTVSRFLNLEDKSLSEVLSLLAFIHTTLVSYMGPIYSIYTKIHSCCWYIVKCRVNFQLLSTIGSSSKAFYTQLSWQWDLYIDFPQLPDQEGETLETFVEWK